MTPIPKSRKSKKELPTLDITANDIKLAKSIPDDDQFNAARGLRMAFWFIEKCPTLEIARLLFNAACDTSEKLNKFMAEQQQNSANQSTQAN